jgi:hypothetical protein
MPQTTPNDCRTLKALDTVRVFSKEARPARLFGSSTKLTFPAVFGVILVSAPSMNAFHFGWSARSWALEFSM